MMLERGGNHSSSEEDDDLNQIRKKRLEQMRNASQICIIEINDSSEFLSIIESIKKVFIFIHIYRDGLDSVQTLNDVLLELAIKYKKQIKIYKVKASLLGTSENFVRFY